MAEVMPSADASMGTPQPIIGGEVARSALTM